MSVLLNEAAIDALLLSETGPVGAFVAGEAERVTLQAQQNVRTYFGSAPTLTVDKDISFSMEGSEATIGIRNVGSKASRLAVDQELGLVNWLTDAVESVLV